MGNRIRGLVGPVQRDCAFPGYNNAVLLDGERGRILLEYHNLVC